MSDLVGFEPPKIDWTSSGPDLELRFKRFRQKCEMLLDGPLKQRTEEQKCKYLLLWTGDYGLDLFNTWTLSEEEKNKLAEYWKRFEEHVKPQSTHILNRFYFFFFSSFFFIKVRLTPSKTPETKGREKVKPIHTKQTRSLMMTRVDTLNTIHQINVEDVEMHLIKRFRNAQQLIQSVMAATILDISNTCYSTKKKSVRTLDDNDNYDERVS